MKNLFKKGLIVLGFIFLMFFVFACGNSKKSDSNTSNVLYVGTAPHFAPYEFLENDKVVGIDAEIIGAIAEDMGMKVEFVQMDFASLITALNSNKFDVVVSAMTVTEDRKQNVDFTNTYQKAVQSIVVTKDSTISTKDDLAGKRVGVQQGTTGDIYCSDAFADDAIDRYPVITDAVQSLKIGKIDAIVIDDQVAKKIIESSDGELKIVEAPYENEEYAMAVKKGNTELLNKINASIDKLKENGKINEIISKYIK